MRHQRLKYLQHSLFSVSVELHRLRAKLQRRICARSAATTFVLFTFGGSNTIIIERTELNRELIGINRLYCDCCLLNAGLRFHGPNDRSVRQRVRMHQETLRNERRHEEFPYGPPRVPRVPLSAEAKAASATACVARLVHAGLLPAGSQADVEVEPSSSATLAPDPTHGMMPPDSNKVDHWIDPEEDRPSMMVEAAPQADPDFGEMDVALEEAYGSWTEELNKPPVARNRDQPHHRSWKQPTSAVRAQSLPPPTGGRALYARSAAGVTNHLIGQIRENIVECEQHVERITLVLKDESLRPEARESLNKQLARRTTTLNDYQVELYKLRERNSKAYEVKLCRKAQIGEYEIRMMQVEGTLSTIRHRAPTPAPTDRSVKFTTATLDQALDQPSSEDEIVDGIKHYEESQQSKGHPLITPAEFSNRIGNMGGSSSGEAKVVEVDPVSMRKRDAQVLRSEHDRSMEALETGVPQEAPQRKDPPEYEEESPNEELPPGTAEHYDHESLLNAPVPDTAVLPELKFAKKAYGPLGLEVAFDPTFKGSPFVKISEEEKAQLRLRG